MMFVVTPSDIVSALAVAFVTVSLLGLWIWKLRIERKARRRAKGAARP